MAKKLINFLSAEYKPSVSCDAVTDDMYPPENLISCNSNKRSLGFMAYSVTKPPVNLNFGFICPANIHYIQIWAIIGSLKSTEFEVYTHNNSNNIKLTAGHLSATNCGVIFYREDLCSNQILPSQCNKNNFLILPFFTNFAVKKSLRNIQTVQICIKSTNRCAPVIQKIEIWGTFSISCSLRQIELIKNIQSSNDAAHSSQIPEISTDVPDKITERIIEETSPYPEEFLDAITYELMTIPMVLPSGKVIDQSTLEKYNKIEECWGRSPSDPFTAQVYTNDRKPLLDDVLKSRIDQFLIRNSNNPIFFNASRILGKSKSKRYLSSTLETEQYRLTDEGSDEKSEKMIKLMESDKHLKTVENSSLACAVQKALKNVTRFTTLNHKKDSKMTLFCYRCENSNDLYKNDVCLHFICRTCLLISSIEIICKCKMKYKKSNVYRYYS